MKDKEIIIEIVALYSDANKMKQSASFLTGLMDQLIAWRAHCDDEVEFFDTTCQTIASFIATFLNLILDNEDKMEKKFLTVDAISRQIKEGLILHKKSKH